MTIKKSGIEKINCIHTVKFFFAGLAVLIFLTACSEENKKPVEKISKQATEEASSGHTSQLEQTPKNKLDTAEENSAKPNVEINRYEIKINDYTGSIPPEELRKLFPEEIEGYEAYPSSVSTIEKDGAIVTHAKAQYYDSETRSRIVIEIMDYSPKKKVFTPEIYTKKPNLGAHESEMIEDIPNAKGFIVWNDFRNAGWIDVIYHGRYAVKVRAGGSKASPDLCREILDNIDISQFKDGKKY